MNILFRCQYDEPYSQEYKQKVREIARGENVIFADEHQWTKEEYHQVLGEAEVICSYIAKKDLQYCKKLKLMILDIAGVDGFIDSPYFPPDAVICNGSGYYGNLIAEHSVALALAICRGLPVYVQHQEKKLWKLEKPDKPVEDSTVLILGAGDIGTAIARDIRPMLGSGKIIGVRRVLRKTPPEFDDMITFAELDEILPEADLIFCVLPHTKETKGLLNGERLRMMKDDAVLVNCGRGSLIPLEDLAAVLQEGKLMGAALDVAEVEPLPPEHPIWNAERLLITPHAAGNMMTIHSPTARRLNALMLENLENYLTGKPLKNVVSRETGYKKTGK